MEDSPLLLDLLQDVLGEVNSHYPNKAQISFDCPVCSYDIKGLDKGDGKGNFEVNYSQGVYKCWACSETYGTHGTLNKLIRKYGNKNHVKQYQLVIPDNNRVVGDKCHAGEGKPVPNDPTASSCCMQPEYKDGRWYLGSQIALNSDGQEIQSYEEGEITCRVPKFNFFTTKDEAGVCVFKSTGRPSI